MLERETSKRVSDFEALGATETKLSALCHCDEKLCCFRCSTTSSVKWEQGRSARRSFFSSSNCKTRIRSGTSIWPTEGASAVGGVSLSRIMCLPAMMVFGLWVHTQMCHPCGKPEPNAYWIHWIFFRLNGSRTPGRLWIYRMEVMSATSSSHAATHITEPLSTYKHSYMLKPTTNGLRTSLYGAQTIASVHSACSDPESHAATRPRSSSTVAIPASSRSKRHHTFPVTLEMSESDIANLISSVRISRRRLRTLKYDRI
ncbi:hypothetical protein B0H15DRAFT_577986 [Mycena belliarum]|uniref:Uncharacterized protein n=1 Tax=Mycena belliarum TaxID=1033014 RepID=A0AAD6TW54_9AGAR|nr:hypothetical protein B0H15DRAFT_577986 [Mycena belliae]